MTIIVKHKRTGNKYILLGINGGGDLAFGKARSDRNSPPSRFLNDLFTKEVVSSVGEPRIPWL
jgi:hypothetical protein